MSSLAHPPVLFYSNQNTAFIVYDPILHACVYSRRPGFDLAALWVPGVMMSRYNTLHELTCILEKLIFEVQVFVLVWWNALERPRANASQLSDALYRDGFLYFITLFCKFQMTKPRKSLTQGLTLGLRLINVIMAIIAPVGLLSLFPIFTLTVYFQPSLIFLGI